MPAGCGVRGPALPGTRPCGGRHLSIGRKGSEAIVPFVCGPGCRCKCRSFAPACPIRHPAPFPVPQSSGHFRPARLSGIQFDARFLARLRLAATAQPPPDPQDGYRSGKPRTSLEKCLETCHAGPPNRGTRRPDLSKSPNPTRPCGLLPMLTATAPRSAATPRWRVQAPLSAA